MYTSEDRDEEREMRVGCTHSCCMEVEFQARFTVRGHTHGAHPRSRMGTRCDSKAAVSHRSLHLPHLVVANMIESALSITHAAEWEEMELAIMHITCSNMHCTHAAQKQRHWRSQQLENLASLGDACGECVLMWVLSSILCFLHVLVVLCPLPLPPPHGHEFLERCGRLSHACTHHHTVP